MMKITIDNKIQGRLFLVGCPRSGTTLLQSLIASHPEIASFPESHFFKYLIPSRPWLCKCGIASRWAKPQLKKFLAEVNCQDRKKSIPQFALLMHQYVTFFLELLDDLTQQQNKKFWLEKTPEHVRRIEYIEKFIPEAKFIHIIRNASDVVASLYEVTHKYPEAWSHTNTPWSIDRCITHWNVDVKNSISYKNKPNHILIGYEQLVADPKSIIANIFDFIGIYSDYQVINNHSLASKKIILDNEPWKKSVKQKIVNANGNKFRQIFTQQEQEYILKETSYINNILKRIIEDKEQENCQYCK